MFDDAESDPKLLSDEADRIIPTLRTQLLKAQYQHLNKQDRALLILVGGIDGAGKGDTINLLNDWMDPRHIRTIAFGPANRSDKQYPPAYRFWQALPPKGQTGIVFGSGYAPLISEAVKKRPDTRKLEDMVLMARRFEADLVANGVQVIKLWFHLSRKAQSERTSRLLENPSTAWKVSPLDKKVHKRFSRLRDAGQRIIEATDSAHSPWIIIPAADENMRNVRTGQAVLQALRRQSIRVPALHDPAELPKLRPSINPLTKLDYTVSIPKDEYDEQMLLWLNRLAEAVRHPKFVKHHSLVLAFEGQDAAGKGGNIRRLTRAMDARQYKITPISAPRQFELNRPHLWRFWREVPAKGKIAIFDRSWYGRVLVERVENLTPKVSWRRGYTEINAFEQQLVNHGAIVLKFWLAITEDEQLKRFKEREKSPFKQFKITADDWRNREKWKEYYRAAGDMLSFTHTDLAPWHVLSSNDKRYARVQVVKRVTQAIENAIKSHD
ncbi:polyphosphate:AMP phosphotransferase [Orrella marina]|uniref:Polyphosphate:AMP phosphotransferase n=1 Tax=Orrella marina TaxID=2163011 RepID=A0A2R4XLE5_9BURK|nr:polyphosphate:AMP phosphotransferase [Orrella marina]AWB34549.1 polyphosphate:AMP phosphotransferase [Orrella marina]